MVLQTSGRNTASVMRGFYHASLTDHNDLLSALFTNSCYDIT